MRMGRIADRISQVTAMVVACTFLVQEFAWAICSDGSTVPGGGFIVGEPPTQNWSPDIFTGTTGSLWVPDTSVFEHNDPDRPLTGGGHNWVFDQATTLCKVTDVGNPGALPTGWIIEPNFPDFCTILPIITNGLVTNLGDIPFQGDAITPTCDPTQYDGNDPVNGFGLPTNTFLNHLGCSISHGVATTPQTATTFLFVAGNKSGLFSIPLDNVINPVIGGQAGKAISSLNYFSQIPSGSGLTGAAVSKDGQFAIATSKTVGNLTVWACLNPLGDPTETDPTTGAQAFPINGPINPFFFVPPGSEVMCMPVGSNGLSADLTTAFGPDNQPYFGGRRVINTFNSVPGSSDLNSVFTAWPNCIWQTSGAPSLIGAFFDLFENGCGTAQANSAFLTAAITSPPALISHGNYMYTVADGGPLYQFLVKVHPITGLSQYKFRILATGIPGAVTGLGTDDALHSLFIYSDPSGFEGGLRESVTKVPLCEDMDGETVTVGAGQGNNSNSGTAIPPPEGGGTPTTTTGTATTTPTSTNTTTTNTATPLPLSVGGVSITAASGGTGSTTQTPSDATARPMAATSARSTASGTVTAASSSGLSAPRVLSAAEMAILATRRGIMVLGSVPWDFRASDTIRGPGFSVKLVRSAAQ